MNNRVSILILSGLLFCFGLVNSGQAMEFTVMSLNILEEGAYNRHGPKKLLSFKQRTTNFKDIFMPVYLNPKSVFAADIIFFYEFPEKETKSEWNILIDNFLQKQSDPTQWSIYRLKGYGIMALVNHKKFDSVEVRSPRKEDLPLGNTKGGALAVIVAPKDTNKKIGIIGCHFEGGPGRKNNGYHNFRREQVKKVMKLKHRLAYFDGVDAFIICGDLNWDISRTPYYLLTKEIQQSFPKKEWNLANSLLQPTNQTYLKPGKSVFKYLDYIFYQPNILTLEKFTFLGTNDALLNSMDDTKKDVWFSDHKALIATFKVI